jgi:hypothetical protein
MSSDNNMTQGRNARTAELREVIQRSFPAEIYDGVITHYDDKLDDPEFDEEKELYEVLKGTRWTDVPQQLLDNKPDGYVRLADEAFAAFIAAWLTRSLENIDGKNEVRDFVVYAFSPKHDLVPDTTEFILQRMRALTPNQRNALRSLLKEFAESDPSAFHRKLALEAVALLEIRG